MIVDASALVAILRNEPERQAFLEAIESAGSVSISAASYVEAGIVIDNWNDPRASRHYDSLLIALRITVVEVTARQAELARAAHRDFGRGSGHPARLNFGDCFSYALAIDVDEPLLFKGKDFVHTDVRRAL